MQVLFLFFYYFSSSFLLHGIIGLSLRKKGTLMPSHAIKEFAKTLHLDAVGIAPPVLPLPPSAYRQSPLCPLAAGIGEERYQPRRLLLSCKSVIVVLFPYYTGIPEDSNLSLYCRSLDYHAIVHTYLNKLIAFLQNIAPGVETKTLIDTSPLDDRWLAYQSGLGFFGDNHCFINDRYGSYCFIGSILTSLPLKADKPLEKTCLHCGQCHVRCPGGCFHDGLYEYGRCKSFLTQKKGSLSLPELTIIQQTPLVFGCDECQRHCPHNQGIWKTPLPEFYENRLLRLEPEDICHLSNRRFQSQYGDRAFAWRGKKILLRNFDAINGTLEAEPRHEGDDGHRNIQEK